MEKAVRLYKKKTNLKYRISFCFIKHLTLIHCTSEHKYNTDLLSIFYMKYIKIKYTSKLQSKSPKNWVKCFERQVMKQNIPWTIWQITALLLAKYISCICQQFETLGRRGWWLFWHILFLPGLGSTRLLPAFHYFSLRCAFTLAVLPMLIECQSKRAG